MKTYMLVIMQVLLLVPACAGPRVIERVRTVEISKPVAAPCPLPADVRPLPAKPPGNLPDDARQALAVALGWLAELWPWAERAAAQQTICSSLPTMEFAK